MIRIERISPEGAHYPAACGLREAVLLRPLGFDLASFRAEYDVEAKAEHFVALAGRPVGEPAVVGVAMLLAGSPKAGVGKVMQVAVDPQRRGEGVGRRVIAAVEARAFSDLLLERLFCHAQLEAIGFWERIGWRLEGRAFLEAGIPHRRMSVTTGEMTGNTPQSV